MFIPRPNQKEVLAYTGGKMGVSAVPGSGKTQTLSYLVAQLLASDRLGDGQEVLVVTLVNSAVSNFATRVAGFLKTQEAFLPYLGYRVRTLHGLAHDIVRERPSLVGLSDDFAIVDERDADQIREEAVTAWVRANPDAVDDLLSPDLDERKADWVRRDQWPTSVGSLALGFIGRAKDLQLAPADVKARLDAWPQPLALARMGCAIYADYQRALTYRNAVDFQDLIRLALQALEADAAYLERLHQRWPFILEDEAQDSSRLQEKILRLLAGPDGNWVRVGDPNQAIYETFTTASPEFLRRFLHEPGVQPRELPDSGRSTPAIISLANYLIDWTQAQHPVAPVRTALQPPHIRPTPPGDPQPNPADETGQVRLIGRQYTPADELQAVVDSLARWLPDHQDLTVAVLVPRNERGFALAEELKKRGIEYIELLRSTRSTREAAGVLGNIINYLAEPAATARLATAYRAWRHADREDEEAKPRLEHVARLLRRCPQVEDFLWPGAERDWLATLDDADAYPGSRDYLIAFRDLARRWQAATLLPIDQLILTLAQDLFQAPADLAIAYKLALVLRQASGVHPEWRLPELTQELAVVARNERRFLGLSDDDTGFDPQRYRGKVVVTTIHKAKGLEWDRVYLMSANNYDFPSALPHDQFISERWFVRDRLNLEAEVLAQLGILDSQDTSLIYVEGQATERARCDYAAERLRLLYVAITRARRDLIITWNTGRGNPPQQPAAPFLALQTWWEEQRHADPR
jgi:DNA helicase-2/ATP-dependent DNA helicase PcrA